MHSELEEGPVAVPCAKRISLRSYSKDGEDSQVTLFPTGSLFDLPHLASAVEIIAFHNNIN